MITLPDIQSAQLRIHSYVKRTPLWANRTLSDLLETNVYLKLELFQTTGAFKVRGAFNKMLSDLDDARRRGVVAVSGGNHAQAVAYASKVLDCRAVIVMMESTPKNYLSATRGYGADVVLTANINEAFEKAHEYQREGMMFVHPFDDPLVMAGQGTMGLEILEDLPHVTDVVLSIGGGGMMGGCAVAIKTVHPQTRLWGVETEGADCMSRALAAGKAVQMPAITSIAKTLGAPAASETTIALARQHLESLIVVSDAEAVAALRLLLERAKVLTEPAASCTLAAALRLKKHFTRNGHLVLVLCGGNLSVADFCRFQAQFPA